MIMYIKMHKCTLRILCLKGLRTVCQHGEKCVKKETNSPPHPPDLLLQMKAIYRFTELWTGGRIFKPLSVSPHKMMPC